MNATAYPNYPAWLDLLAQREAGFLLILLLAVIVVATLWNGQRYFPKQLPYLRGLLLLVFYLLTLVSVWR